MILADLDQINHPATIEGNLIRVRNFTFDADGFTLSGLKLVDYDEAEEKELIRIGLLSQRAQKSAG